MARRVAWGVGAAVGLVVGLRAGGAAAGDVSVKSADEIGAAIAGAKAGDRIVIEDGTYDSTGWSCNAGGTAADPIVVTARNAGKATIRFDALEGFKVGGDHWHFEDLVVQGVCADDSNCEHAFHVSGASGFVLRGSRISDFNAQLKVNVGAGNKLPNGGLVEGNELFDTRARNTSNPVTKLDMDSGDDWIVRANVIHDYEKGGGDNISYAAFLKCGGNRGLMERNLVLCSRDTTGGTRIGLSLGGGGCDPTFCEPSFDPGTPCLEHTDGVVRNNIVVNCSDVGVYVNQSKNSRVEYNTLIATSGIDFRFDQTTGEAKGNVLAGKIRNRTGANATFADGDNLTDLADTDFTGWYTDPMHGDLTKKGDLSRLLGKGPAVAIVTDDYCARARVSPFDLGALQASLGDCATTAPPLGDGGAAATGDSGVGSSGSSGSSGTSGSSGASGSSGSSGTSGSSGDADGGAGSAGGDDGGCACNVPGTTAAGSAPLVLMVLALLRRKRSLGRT